MRWVEGSILKTNADQEYDNKTALYYWSRPYISQLSDKRDLNNLIVIIMDIQLEI